MPQSNPAKSTNEDEKFKWIFGATIESSIVEEMKTKTQKTTIRIKEDQWMAFNGMNTKI